MLLGSVISQKVLPVAPDGLFYCPSMDLLALLLGGSSLAVFRLNWQKLLTLPVAQVAAVSWTPSGKGLTVLSTSGELAMWFTETGECVKRVAAGGGPESSGSAALAWSRLALDAAHLVRFGAGAGQGFPASLAAHVKPLQLEPVLEVAVVCRGGAAEVWWLWGGFQMLVLECPGVTHGWLSADLCNLVLVTHAQESVSVYVQPLPLLARRAHELCALAVADANLQSLLRALTAALEGMAAAWRGARATVASTLEVLQRRLDEAGSGEPLPEVLLDLLLCGPRIDGTLMWLESDLGEKGATKLLQAVAEGATAVLDGCRTLLLPLAEQLLARARALAELRVRDEAFAALFRAGAQPFADLCEHCEALHKRVVQGLGPELEQLQRPTLAFCNWLLRRQRLAQFEETVNTGDEMGRKEAEGHLNAQRDKAPLNERLVAVFMQDPQADGCARVLEGLLFDATRGEALRARARDSLAPLCVSDRQFVVAMPAEELRGAALHSEDGTGAAALALHRRDDVALVAWESLAVPQAHQLAVYDALEGDVVSAQYYRDGALLVLSCDEDAGTSMLALVENGNEVKTRAFTGRANRLTVSTKRNLAAVQLGAQVVLVDLVAEDEEAEAAPEPMVED